MLPFTKRGNSIETSEQIHTGDFEVIRPNRTSNRAGALPQPPSNRPRAFARSVSDEEMTTLMPRKGLNLSSRPPAPLPMPQANTRASNRPRPQMDEPTRAFVRPSAPPPSVSPAAPAPKPPSVAPTALGSPYARQALKPQPIPAELKPRADRRSDPPIDPPATVITARTRAIARPTASWAAALVAMGVFVGLVTAVVARGDADSLIDATASFVDPSGSHASAASASLIALPTKFVDTSATLASVQDTVLAPAKEDAAVASNDTASAAPMPQRTPPVAYAAPVKKAAPVYHAPAPRAASHEDRVAAAPKPAPVKASRHAAANDDDMESASAADALAKAQLEASLR